MPPGDDHFPCHVVDHVTILGVDVHQGAGGPGRTEEAQKRVVADAEFVNHENLEARVASRDDRWDLGEVRVADFGEDDVEAVVDVSLVAGLGLPRPDGFCDRLPAALPSVIADGSDASAGRCRGARFEIVGGVDSADIHVEMRMHVHSAGQYLEPGGVDFLARAWERLADLDDAASSDSDVCHEAVGGRDDGAAANDQVVAHPRDLTWLIDMSQRRTRVRTRAVSPTTPPAATGSAPRRRSSSVRSRAASSRFRPSSPGYNRVWRWTVCRSVSRATWKDEQACHLTR